LEKRDGRGSQACGTETFAETAQHAYRAIGKPHRLKHLSMSSSGVCYSGLATCSSVLICDTIPYHTITIGSIDDYRQATYDTNMKERRRVKNQNYEKDIYLVEITLTAILVRGGGDWWKASSVTTKPLSTF